jgi:hypothetical protein
MYREIMLRNKSVFQISTLICLSSISICNLLIDLPLYYVPKIISINFGNLTVHHQFIMTKRASTNFYFVLPLATN